MNLDELKQTRRTLLGAEAAATQAVRHAQKHVDGELFNVRECERELDAARDRAAYDAALLALDSAKKDHVLAVKRLEDRQGERAYADMQARTAEAMVVQAVDKLLNTEREALASECIAMYEHLTRKISDLRAVVPDELNTPRHLVLDLSPAVTRALNLVPPPDATMIPVNILQSGTPGNAEAWAARREGMIADIAVQEDAAA